MLNHVILERVARAAIAASAAWVLLLSTMSVGAANEVQTINAFSIWQGKRQVVSTGEKSAVVVGAFGGVLFVETTEGPVDTGIITCPGMLQVDLETGRQKGSGECSFTAYDGAHVFGEWQCVGIHQIGCKGEFKITRGTDRLAGASGKGSMLIRTRLHEIVIRPGDLAQEAAIGIAVWRDLRVTISSPAAVKK